MTRALDIEGTNTFPSGIVEGGLWNEEKVDMTCMKIKRKGVGKKVALSSSGMGYYFSIPLDINK